MNSLAEKCFELACNEVFCRGDDLGCGFRKSLVGASLDGRSGETQSLDGHPHRDGRGRDNHKSVSDASELSVVDEQVVDVLENNFFQIGRVERVALVLASHNGTSPDARVHSRSDDCTSAELSESIRHRSASEQFEVNPNSSALLNVSCDHFDDPAYDICGYWKRRRG